MRKVRVGIVGIGMIAHMFHIPKYQNHPQVEITAIADLDLERAKEVADQLGGIPAYGSALEMFRSEKLDAVSIATFNESHVELAMLALDHGLDVLVEKPMAVSSEQAIQLREKAAAGDRIVMVGMSARFRYDCRALHGIVESGDLGEIYFAKARILRRRGVPFGWFTNFAQSGGGPMMDIGVHALDAVWWMMGKPEPDLVVGKLFRKVAPFETEGVGFYSAMSKDNKENPVYDVEDLGSAYITFKNGAALTIEASWAVNGSEDDAMKIDLFGTKGGASLDPFTMFKESDRIPVSYGLKVQENDFYQEEMNHFIDCVLTRKQPVIDAAQGMQIVRMLEAIRRSSETNSAVKL
ncbi:Gfo/Idh/MocA family oxidoreductase [Cohnella pontilimi]|uniref:Gfo/Idh/MocA family oxidoreductase n=1 Tax=Cohnella pontilimi TaxID=2564100 RepID=A0A4U0FGC4_9BACL|nr:Gfo/Idh/MocA family oxidoreductase [Cohnella pontilimi]TJY44043.1 Gfo/Idh/MocA family oxidoreductase [Cohnella pontilimi]